MKSNIIYIVLFFALCFGLKAQAQITVQSLEEKKSAVQEKDREKLDFLFQGTPTSLYFDREGKTQRLWERGGGVKVIYLTKQGLVSNLSNLEYSKDFSSAEAIIIEVDDINQLSLTKTHLTLLENLKYILLRIQGSSDKSQIERSISGIYADEEAMTGVEVLYVDVEPAT